MRRGRGAAGRVVLALGACAGLLLGGCASGPQVGDGTIGADWVSFPDPTVPTPQVGVCRDALEVDRVEWRLELFAGEPYACSAPHRTETYHVAQLTGAALALPAPPEVGDEEFVDAFGACADAAKGFLGDVWQRARVRIVPVLPSDRQWRGKARWLRCEMLEVADDVDTVVLRSASLRDGLRGSAGAALTCATDTGSTEDTVDLVVFVDCAKPHTVEFGGVHVESAVPYPGNDEAIDEALKACERIGARYLGLSDAAFRSRADVGWLVVGADEDLWTAGDRSFRCFVGTYDRNRPIVGSIRNIGNKALPH
jgi:hypothetical protein